MRPGQPHRGRDAVRRQQHRDRGRRLRRRRRLRRHCVLRQRHLPAVDLSGRADVHPRRLRLRAPRRRRPALRRRRQRHRRRRVHRRRLRRDRPLRKHVVSPTDVRDRPVLPRRLHLHRRSGGTVRRRGCAHSRRRLRCHPRELRWNGAGVHRAGGLVDRHVRAVVRRVARRAQLDGRAAVAAHGHPAGDWVRLLHLARRPAGGGARGGAALRLGLRPPDLHWRQL
mmetsp:Transcript_30617/g.80154  ORF Transcript_30617/g.80154 Transcript_30617/m.80154 type:complete len:225 (-) Transcript_30617:1272-1946(-)